MSQSRGILSIRFNQDQGKSKLNALNINSRIIIFKIVN